MNLVPTPAVGPRKAQRPLDRWSERTAAELGSVPSDWYDPTCSALVVALRTGLDDVAVLHRYVGRRVRAGWGLRSIMGDLERLRRSLGPRRRWSSRWRVLWLEAAAAYADEVIDDLLFTTGRDPLSGLPDHRYLTVHLEELVTATRADDDVRPQLLLVEAPPAGSSVTDRMAATILVADVLRVAVPRGVLVAQVREDGFVVVLPPLIPVDPVRAEIEAALCHRSQVDAVVVTSTALPRTRVELAALLGTRWRQPPDRA